MKRIKVIDILRQESDRTGVPIKEILGSARNAEMCHLRHYIMWRARIETGLSYPQIGRQLGKDHTSVLHGVRRIEAMPMDQRRYDPPKIETEFPEFEVIRQDIPLPPKAPHVFKPIYKVA